MAVCQGGEGVVWSGLLRDGISFNLLLREQLGARMTRFKGVEDEGV